MATSYLTLVNDVLVRLREPTVTSVSSNEYSSLIGKLVNDAKREVEDSWKWEVLKSTYSVSTTQDIVSYTLTGSGYRFIIDEVINDTSNWFMVYRPASFFTENLMLVDTPISGPPEFYCANGNDNNGDLIVDVYPKPDTAYTLRFSGYTPEAELTTDNSLTKLPKSPIVLLAWAKAIEERGEDGGINVSSQYAVAKQSLADHIAIEAGRHPEETIWYPV